MLFQEAMGLSWIDAGTLIHRPSMEMPLQPRLSLGGEGSPKRGFARAGQGIGGFFEDEIKRTFLTAAVGG